MTRRFRALLFIGTLFLGASRWAQASWMQRYEIGPLLGQGTYGRVYLSRRLSDGKEVVLKMIPFDNIPPEEQVLTPFP